MQSLNEKILRSALASKIAYAPDCKIVSNLPASYQLQGIKNISCKIVDIKKTGAHVYCWNSGENAKLIAFRGVHDYKYMLNYMNPKMKEIHLEEYIKVHSNILDNFYSLEEELSDYIFDKPINNKKKSITFCGHSAGGVLAMIAAAYYGDITGDNTHITCHTFGSPKVGNIEFHKWYDRNVDESVNIANKHDYARHIPFGFNYVYNKNIIIEDNTLNPLKAHDLDTYQLLLENEIMYKKI